MKIFSVHKHRIRSDIWEPLFILMQNLVIYRAVLKNMKKKFDKILYTKLDFQVIRKKIRRNFLVSNFSSRYIGTSSLCLCKICLIFRLKCETNAYA